MSVDLSLAELSKKSMSCTPDQVLILSLERLLHAKKFEVTEKRHNEKVAELKTRLEKAHLKIKLIEDQVFVKNTEIETLKSGMQNTNSYSQRSSDQVQKTMEDDEDYETFDWASGQFFSAGFHSVCGGNFTNARETTEKSTCTDDSISTVIDLQSQKDIPTISITEESDTPEEISSSPLNFFDSSRISSIFPVLIQAESQATDQNDFELQMLTTLGNYVMKGGSTRTSVNSGSFVCTYCHVTLGSRVGLHQHLFGLHSEQRGMHKCEPCRKGYLSKTELIRHKRRVHKTGVPSFPCRHCGKKFYSTSGRYEHEQLHIGTNRQFKRAQCTKCDKSYGTFRSLEHHMNKAHSKAG